MGEERHLEVPVFRLEIERGKTHKMSEKRTDKRGERENFAREEERQNKKKQGERARERELRVTTQKSPT